MKDIPFYPNRADNKSCALAVYKSILEYLTGRPYKWEELESLAGFENNKAAWTVKIWTELASQGFDIHMIEGFDYKRYYKEGVNYLDTFLKPEEVKWHLKNSNLLQIHPLIPKFLQSIKYEKRSPKLEDIDEMLAKGYLVTVQLNSKTLNNETGYVAHMILVHGKRGNSYIAHDPGQTNAQANRSIQSSKLFEAMGGPNNTVEVTGIKKS